MKNKEIKIQKDNSKKITRKEALKKGGKYAALTAASMLMILSPKESQADSPTVPTAWPTGY